MLKIGEFSKLVGLSTKTLRYYEEFGLLLPCYVDSFTGYRYYSKDQIIDCQKISYLKRLNFSLNEIKEYKDNLSEEILEAKKEELTMQINELCEQINELSNLQSIVKKEAAIKDASRPKVLKRTLNNS